MGIPSTIEIDRRLPDHVETAQRLVDEKPGWVPGEFHDLRRLLYPVFRVEFTYTDGGERRGGAVLLDGLRAGNDEYLGTYRPGTAEPTTLDPVDAYDLQTGDGGRTVVLGHQCTNDQARTVLPKRLAYAKENSAIDNASSIRRTFTLPEAVTPSSFGGVANVKRLYLPFWIGDFHDEEGTSYRAAFRPPVDGTDLQPARWLSWFVVEEASLVTESILTEMQADHPPGGPATEGADHESSEGRAPSDGANASPADAASATGGATAQASTTDADDRSAPAEKAEAVQPDGVETLHAPTIVDPAPERGFEDVGGMADLKDRLRSAVIDPVRHAGRYETYGLGTVTGVLLHGPPGCGKTHVAGSLAGELDWRFLQVTPADLTSKYVGEPAEKVADLFAIARANEPCVVFIDEIDGVASPRDEQDSQSQQQLVNQLLTELETIGGADVLVVAATNLIEDVDPAIRRSGRFDERIEVPPPDADARREILRIHLAERPVDPDISLQEAVIETAGFAASDLELVVDEAARIAMQDHAEITETDLLTATNRVDSSIEEWIGRYDGLVEEASGRGAVVQPEGVEHLQATRLVDRNVSLSFEDVGGMDDLKTRFREVVIDPIERAEAYAEYGLGTVDGVLLHGPPGCGKTYVTRALAGELGRYYIEVSPADLTSKYVGEPAEKVAELFAIARANQPCILLLDELDAVAGTRGGMDSQSQQQLVNQLLTELEGLDDEEVVVVGTTNLVEDVDPAIRRSGRFDERVEVPPPDADARREILRIHLEESPRAAEIDWTAVVDLTRGFAASDLELLAEEAARRALRSGQVVTTQVLVEAAGELESSIAGWG